MLGGRPDTAEYFQNAYHDMQLGETLRRDAMDFRTLVHGSLEWLPLPIGSMSAIYGNIYHQYTPNVSIYTIHGSYGLGRLGVHFQEFSPSEVMIS